MVLLEKLLEIWSEENKPFLVDGSEELYFKQVLTQDSQHLKSISTGDVVAVIGDFDAISISNLLILFSRGAIVVPLTIDTQIDHEYFFDSALVDFVVKGSEVVKRRHSGSNALIEQLRTIGHAGLVLFSTGTTGRPKAILHDFEYFLARFVTPRPSLTTLNFLLFDHIGGINTLFHTLFNRGLVVAPSERTVESILATCKEFDVEVLPTTPTFLRMMLLSGMLDDNFPDCIRIITYGTERMDEPTLTALCEALPLIDFRQTYGMSELGILRVKSLSRNSLFMKIGGEGVETRIVENVLQIKSTSRMLGYLNAEYPFSMDGWYDTKDMIEYADGYIKIVGRSNEVINVGGLKFMGSEVERMALMMPGIKFAKATAKPNPITGEHVELSVQLNSNSKLDKDDIKAYLGERLPTHMRPVRISLESLKIGHRFKKM